MIKKKKIPKILFFSALLLVIFLTVNEKSDKYNVVQDDLTNRSESTTIQKEENGDGGPQYIQDDYINLFKKEENGDGGPQLIEV